jgi:hypothetical protein
MANYEQITFRIFTKIIFALFGLFKKLNANEKVLYVEESTFCWI